MSYKYKVSLNGIKGFYRIYQIDGDSSLYSLHKQMRSDMEFPQDQLILFKAMDSEGKVVARYGLFDLGDGTADEISISRTIEAGITSFVYFYDITNKKSINITFEGEVQGSVFSPVIIESKGPNPIEFENGYVAFEDLPDEKRHLPGEDKPKSKLAELLNIDMDKDFEDDEEEDEDEEEEEEEEDDETAQIYDANEGLDY